MTDGDDASGSVDAGVRARDDRPGPGLGDRTRRCWSVASAVASAERRRFDYRHTATRRKKAIGYVMLGVLLPILAAMLWGAFRVGASVGAGDLEGILHLARWYLPLLVGAYVLYGVDESGKRMLTFGARELHLTAVEDRTLALGLLLADGREQVWALFGPSVALGLAYGAGAGSPATATVATLALVLLTTSATLLGYVVGLGSRSVLRRLPVSRSRRELAKGVGSAVTVVTFGLGGAVVGVGGMDALAGDGAPLAAMTPSGPPPVPLGYYADLFFLGTPHVDGLGLATVSSALVVLAAVPACVWAVTVLAPRCWYTEVTTPETVDEPAVEASAPATRPAAPWQRTPTGYVADGLLRRSIRRPKRLLHLSYYLYGVAILAAGLFGASSSPWTPLGGALVAFGLWTAGGAVGLNPLGEEGSMLDQLVLSAFSPATFVRARVLVGALLGAPFVLAGTILLGVDALAPTETVLLGGVWLALLPASAAIAVGVGSLLPTTEPGRILNSIEVRVPSRLAILVHALLSSVLGGAAAATVVVVDDPSLRAAGLAGLGVATVVVADASYRFARASVADYGWTKRPDPIYAIELAVGLGLLAVVLSRTVQLGVAVLLPLTETPARFVAFAASYVGVAVAGVAYLVASDRSLDYVDVTVPTAGHRRLLAIGLVGSLGVSATHAGVTHLLDRSTSHAIADGLLAGGPLVVVGLALVAVLVIGPVEEFVFRNVLQKRLAGTISEPRAIVVAAVVFAGTHLPVYLSTDPVTVVVSLAPLAVLGALWGWLFARTENLVVPALCHGLYDAVVFLVAGLWMG